MICNDCKKEFDKDDLLECDANFKDDSGNLLETKTIFICEECALKFMSQSNKVEFEYEYEEE